MSIETFEGLKDQTISHIQFGYYTQGHNTVFEDKERGEGQDRSHEVRFTLQSGERYKLFHYQDCCETVRLFDVEGNWNDLIGHPLVLVEESTKEAAEDEQEDGSGTWTFYRMGTIKGTVVMRWLGSSNGYYSESVDFEKVED